MLLARVIGTVVATRKDPGLAGHDAPRPPAPAPGPHAGRAAAGRGRLGGRGGDRGSLLRARARGLASRSCPRRSPPTPPSWGSSDHWNRRTVLIGRVVGNVVATQKNAKLEGAKLLLVQPLDLDGAARGTPVLAIDGVDAGVGDRVLLIQDGRAAQHGAGPGSGRGRRRHHRGRGRPDADGVT